jgi:(E)-4-hydroxy-3-methylbut-2-enyl-diphosphate synthase
MPHNYPLLFLYYHANIPDKMNKEQIKHFSISLTKYSRWKTREVFIGDIPLGGKNPVRIQSMTTTDTMNTAATVAQTIRMVEAGCEYVRITAPSKLEAQNLQEIKNELRRQGYKVPLIADIHFTPNAAELAARIVEKVRVNPGNYADKKKFEVKEYSDSDYNRELERIREKFHPLVKICKEYGTAMRIGTNHGSLSDRIMSRYGDTPIGMVESALEFVRFCEELNYYNIVLSMKSSNPQVMVQAYRLLVQKMEEEEMNYPLHLGVTEAGGGEDGRIKSAVGIGTLLEDGIGDTIRVSLTEDPEFEAPVAILLRDRYNGREEHAPVPEADNIPLDLFKYSRRITNEAAGTGGSTVPVVVLDYSGREITPESFRDAGYTYNEETDKWNLSDAAADIIYAGDKRIDFPLPSGLKTLYNYRKWISDNEGYPYLKAEEYLSAEKLHREVNFVEASLKHIHREFLNKISQDERIVLVLTTDNLHGMAEQRRAFIELINNDIRVPVIIKRNYGKTSSDKIMLYSATDMGGLLIDGLGDGIWISAVVAEEDNKDGVYRKILVRKKETSESIINRISFGILQAARVRISRTEYIACPSCGRTLFDLQETTEMIRKRTEHLKGVKIAIMGCIVNGPGEMADADYGYVGSGVDKITLYRGKDIVKRNITSQHAVDILIDLIKEDNNWSEPKN